MENMKAINPIGCHFYDAEKVESQKFPYFKRTVYKIYVTVNREVREINKYYSDFLELDCNLRNSGVTNVPEFPPKYYFFETENFIKKRKSLLHQYMYDILQRDDIFFKDLIFNFLEINQKEYMNVSTRIAFDRYLYRLNQNFLSAMGRTFS